MTQELKARIEHLLLAEGFFADAEGDLGKWAREAASVLREALSTEQTPDGEESQRPVAVNNGNTFVFCDYVGRGYGGCIRGAGHNGPHVFAQGDTLPQAPVLLERGETR